MDKKYYRQGEIIFSSDVEGELKKGLNSEHLYRQPTVLKTKVIREGEATGHCHKITEGTLYTRNGVMFLRTETATQIVHPEHKTLTLPKGDYEIGIQREYDESGKWRNVLD